MKKGFTLVEMLVVVSIIALISSILFSNLDDVKKKSRDLQRFSDLKAIQTALELYKNQYGKYPDGDESTYISYFTSNPGPGTISYPTIVSKDDSLDGSFLRELVDKHLLNKMILDPLNKNSYVYYYYRGNAATVPHFQFGCTPSTERITYELYIHTETPRPKELHDTCYLGSDIYQYWIFVGALE